MAAKRSWASVEGTSLPLGARWLAAERAVDFSLYSKHAETVTLLLYSADDPLVPVWTHELEPGHHKSGRVWHVRVAEEEMRDARCYAYRVSGPVPAGRTEWHAFDPEKILLDPYAARIHFPAGFDRGSAMRPGPNAGRAPLGVIPSLGVPFDWGDDRPPRHESDLVIYELHVRGFTRHPSSGVAPAWGGTFLGLADRIPYLVDLGVTAVELMPVFQFDPQEGNYWGYMPLSFFAPHAGYASPGGDPHDEFRTLVRALHAAGIEVILDVVYNHTAEGGENGPVYGCKGIDNSTYYLMTGDPNHPYADFSGTGNTLHTANAAVRKLVLDSLRYWVQEMHVDGFRFDLASIFARDERGEVELTHPGIFAEISSDPLLASVRLIAEPWDLGGDHLGRSFPGISWAQWNARFRDDVRRAVRGDPGLATLLRTRLYGSDDLFPDDRMHAFHPYQSVNYVTAHDGFTLYDLVSYERKRNWANGHANQDGPLRSYGWNCGWEGDEGPTSEVLELRRRQAKNFCAVLLLANGTPLLRAGDEFLQTQGGNDNPYNQDNPTTWLDWSRAEEHAEVLSFFRRMIAFRKEHPSLCRSRFWRGDVRWHGPDTPAPTGDEAPVTAYTLYGASVGDDDLYVMMNFTPDERDFVVQGEAGGWRRAVDTAAVPPLDLARAGDEPRLESPVCRVAARSVVVLRRVSAPPAP